MNFRPINGAAYSITGVIKALNSNTMNINCICAGRDGKNYKFVTLKSRLNEYDETEFSPLVFTLSPDEIDEISIKQLVMNRA